MKEQDPEQYIKKLEILKELEGKDLIASEIVLKYQDLIVRQLLGFPAEKALPREEEYSSKEGSLPKARAEARDRNHIFFSYSHKD